MADQPIIESSVRTDANGNWQLDFLDQLEPGLHPVVAIDEFGNQDYSIIFIEETIFEPRLGSSLTQRLQMGEGQPLLPPFFAYAVFFLLLIIILLSVNMVRLGGKIDKEILKRKNHEARLKEVQTQTCNLEKQYKKQHRYLRNATVVAVVAVVLSLVFGVVLNYQVGVFDKKSITPTVATTLVSVSGSLITPFENQGVPGVDILAGETRIRTDESGWYSFTNISLADGVRLTHPNLSRAIVKGLEEFSINNQKTAKAFPVKIYFDVNLFNTLIKVVDLEARGRYNEIYEQIALPIQESLPQTEFVNNYQPIFSVNDISDQELVITNITTHSLWTSKYDLRLNDVVAITLSNEGQEATYYLMQIDDLWLLVR